MSRSSSSPLRLTQQPLRTPAGRRLALRSRFGRRCGITLVELLLGLAIGAILLTSMALATKAYCGSYTGNRDYNTALQAARLAMLRMCSDVRQANDGGTVGSSTLVVDTDRGQNTYSLDSSGHLNLSTGGASSVLARNIRALNFTAKADGTGYLVNVEISMTVALKNGSFTLSDSAIVRRNRTLPDRNNPSPYIAPTATYVNPPPL